ncbi:hypothetical protein JHK85_004642 [Glycine max]|nr:hypothetical protein JHK85_004642 [Glycine max]KAG5080401.1 hypothetical protein JHK86_004466 [Glycine max]
MVDLDLSKLLPDDVFEGFSAFTGEYTQLNSIRSWNFSSWEEHIEKNPKNLSCSSNAPYERPSMRTVLLVLIGEVAPPIVALEKHAFTWSATAPVLNEEFNFQVTFAGTLRFMVENYVFAFGVLILGRLSIVR